MKQPAALASPAEPTSHVMGIVRSEKKRERERERERERG
jgi:hypothetical protein